ncbi:TIGR03915 family putative DNA repair protein [Croceiramulus getboli]|nr:TIGR03915 family putative DNA repair protein [Flavobacteriaceae bacterium YJPT1-3]
METVYAEPTGEVALQYDGSFEGFLTGVFLTFAQKLEVVAFQTDRAPQGGLFSQLYSIDADPVKAERVWKGLSAFAKAQYHVYRSFLSEIKGNEIYLLRYIQYIFESGTAVDYGHEASLRATQISKMVGREKHRMEAFIRFELTTDGIYYAMIEPDFNVLPLIAPHFKDRYADQPWIIHDLKRGYALYYDEQTVSPVTLDPPETDGKEAFEEEETQYKALWHDYFRSTNIKARVNKKLHIQHVPRRYWKYLSEKDVKGF